MKVRIARVAIIVAEAAGVLIAAVVAITAILFWRVQAASVDLDWTVPVVRAAANAAAFDGAVKGIDRVALAKIDPHGGYRLDLFDVRLGRASAEADAKIPHIEIEFYPRDLLSGKMGPRRILIDRARLRIVRRADRKLKLDFGEAGKERASVFRALTGGAYFREAFERAALTRTTIVFQDEASGRTWIGRDGEAEVVRTKNGYEARLASRFDIGGKPASLAFDSVYDLAREVISSKLSLENAPVGDLIAVFFNANADPLTAPISGAAAIDLADDGTVLSSRLDLRAGKGVLALGPVEMRIDAMTAAAAFEPARNEFSVERVAWNGESGAGALSGVVSLDPKADGKGLAKVNFALESGGVSLVRPDLFDAPLALERVSAEGVYDLGAKSLTLSDFAAEFLGVRLAGRLSVEGKRHASPAVSAAAKVEGAIGPAALMKAWPKTLAVGARDFIATRMPRGAFSAIDAKIDVKSRAPGEPRGLVDDEMALSFRMSGGEVIYAPEMTPLKNVEGAGVLRGNSFRFLAETATVGKVRLSKGEVEIPVLTPKGETSFFRFNASGDAGDIIAILAEEPLAVLEETSFTPEQFSGPASLRAEISRPNLRVAPRESYQYKGAARFEDLNVENIIGDATLSNAKGKLDLTTAGMTIVGEGRVGDAPVLIEWRQRFYGDGDKTVITVKGEADSATADLFGLPTRQFVQGSAPFTAVAVGGVDAFRALELKADLTAAALVSESLGWMKPKGAPATAAAKFEFSDAGTKIAEMRLEGAGLSILGAAAFSPGGALIAFDAPKFSLDGAADLALSARRNEAGALEATATGAYLNAGELMRNLVDNGLAGTGGKAPFGLNARIDRIDLRAGASYRDAALAFRRNAEHIEAWNFSAVGEEGKRLSVDLRDSKAAGSEQAIEAKTDDVGRMLSGVFGLTSVKGGRGRLDFTFTPGAAERPRKGALEAHDLRVVKAPLLAKIFAAGSLTGLADLMNGEGIELQNAMAVFSIEEGAIRISEARATGPSVGITGAGAYSLSGDREVDLSGAVAPAYQVNSFLGKTPVIGDLFVNRKGEGVLALSYSVDGPAGEPRVTVNPLSALAPGVLRRMFEGAREEDPPAE